VVRELLDRLDGPLTGKCIKELETELPAFVIPEAEKIVALTGNMMRKK